MMRKTVILILLCCLSIGVQAINPRDSLSAGFGKPCYTLKIGAAYAYNRSLESMGNFHVQTLLPFHSNIEMIAGIGLSTANIYSGRIVIRPKVDFRVGELYWDAIFDYRSIVRDNQWNCAMALAMGYRMDYLNLQIGWCGRVMNFYPTYDATLSACEWEKFNLLYRLEIYCRPQRCRWNLMFCATDYDDFVIERMAQPLFLMNGRYDIDNHWRVEAEAEMKPTGMMHMNATFYSATFKVGFSYQF